MLSHRHKEDLDYINRLPTEILDLIFQDVAAVSAKVDESQPNRAIFPFNVASVCYRWLAILKSRPQFWRYIIIDVADDPAPFLDTFALSSQYWDMQYLHVIVFSSEKSHSFGSHHIPRKRENLRMKTVFEHLEPFLACFERISFHLVFQSSLPSAAKFFTLQLPLLIYLTLDCQIYDINAEGSIIKINKPPHPPKVDFPSLRILSLTGYALVELYQLGSAWWRQFKLSACISELSITHLEFSESTGGCEENLTLIPFMGLLFEGKRFYDEILLSDLSLSYHPATTLHTKFNFAPQHCTFDNVSRDFLMDFFSCISILNTEDLDDIDITFRRCSIPDIRPINEHHNLVELKLENIPFQASTFYSPDLALPPSDDSLCNAISIFLNVTDLELKNCNGVTDKFFEWLSGEEDKAIGASLQRLLLHDCTGYTRQGLYSFVCKRANIELTDSLPAFDELEISGISPLLEHDVAWLLEQNETDGFLEWSVNGDDLIGWSRYR